MVIKTSIPVFVGFCLLAVPTAVATPIITPPSPERNAQQISAKPTWQSGVFKHSPLRMTDAPAAARELPFNDTFQDGDETRASYTFLDVDNDGVENSTNSVFNKWFWKEDERLIQHCVDLDNPVPANDWLFTPAIHLDGQNLYKLTLEANMGAQSNIRVTIGTSTDPADQHEIMDLNGINSPWPEAYSKEFAVEEDANYYIGIYNYSGTDGWYFNLFSIDVQAGASALVPEVPPMLSVEPDAEGLIGATVKFTAPSHLANGKEITGAFDVKVYRNDSKVNTISCLPGEQKVWHDDAPLSGENTYAVAGVVDGKEGLKAETTVWVGVDKPKTPSITAISTTNGNLNVELEWTPVTEGANGAYFVPEAVTYTVYRGFDRNKMEAIAENLKTTSFTDTGIAAKLNGRQDACFYGIIAFNDGGYAESSAKVIAVGEPLKFPQTETFPNGRLELTPWLTDPISGSFSWECVKNSDGVEAQDHDNGMSRFYAYYGGDTDSRLKSPVFTLEGTKSPMFSLWMFHWQDYTVEADGGATRLVVEVCADGGEWKPLGEPLLAGYPVYGWVEHQFLLADLKDAKTVQFGLRGQTDNSWMYFFIDNLRFEEQPGKDLTVTSFYGTAEANIGDFGSYRVEYYNRGKDTAKNYSVDLYLGDQLINSIEGEDLNSGDSALADFAVEFNATRIGNNALKVVINYPEDENPENNASSPAYVKVSKSAYPEVNNLAGECTGDNNIVLNWGAPTIPGADETVLDGAEDYEPWLINEFGHWLSVDNDGAGSGYWVDLPKWPNCETNQAFIIWSPDQLDQTIIEDFPSLKPWAGDQCFVAWLANQGDFWNDPVNDDYLISPEVAPGTKVSFMVKGISTIDLDETYQVMYSSTGRRPEDFTAIESSVATKDWTKVEVTLPDDARYFAIRYTASFQTGLMVDDIEYVSANSLLQLVGYDVFRNGVKLNAEPVQEAAFVDKSVPEGTHAYSVAAVYDRGSSNACAPVAVTNTGSSGLDAVGADCTISVSKGSLTINAPQATEVGIYRPDGTSVARITVEGTRTIALPGGLYIIKAGTTISKAVL